MQVNVITVLDTDRFGHEKEMAHYVVMGFEAYIHQHAEAIFRQTFVPGVETSYTLDLSQEPNLRPEGDQ